MRGVVRGSGSLSSPQSLLSPTVHVRFGEHEQSGRSENKTEPDAACNERPSNPQLQRRFQVLVARGNLSGRFSRCYRSRRWLLLRLFPLSASHLVKGQRSREVLNNIAHAQCRRRARRSSIEIIVQFLTS